MEHYLYRTKCHVMWIPVITTWGALGLRMEETPSRVEGICKYSE